jgi:hypothetical protein
MPPGTWHEVYTPVQGLCSGGHFLLYDALHLTAASREFDRSEALASTNDTHPSIYRTLCRMLIQVTRLPDRSMCLNIPPIHNFDRDSIPAFYRKPVLALCRMVLERSRYISAPTKRQPTVSGTTAGLVLSLRSSSWTALGARILPATREYSSREILGWTPASQFLGKSWRKFLLNSRERWSYLTAARTPTKPASDSSKLGGQATNLLGMSLRG